MYKYLFHPESFMLQVVVTTSDDTNGLLAKFFSPLFEFFFDSRRRAQNEDNTKMKMMSKIDMTFKT